VLNTSALIQKAANYMFDLESPAMCEWALGAKDDRLGHQKAANHMFDLESPAMCEWALGAKDDRLDHDDQCGPSPSTPLSAHASRLGVLNYA
jgi:hypothetical protein